MDKDDQRAARTYTANAYSSGPSQKEQERNDGQRRNEAKHATHVKASTRNEGDRMKVSKMC